MTQHAIATVNVPGFRGKTLNLLQGCKGHACKPHCWMFNRVTRRMADNPSITCPKCKTGEPHAHFERAKKIPKTGMRYCYFQDMAEMEDFSDEDIFKLMNTIAEHPRHIFQILTHFPASFYARHPQWSDNTWAMGTFTEGSIYFPVNLKAGVVAAYCEPMTGRLDFSHEGRFPNWLVIGLMTGSGERRYPTRAQVEGLIIQAYHKYIPVFLKPHPYWKELGLDKFNSEFPKGYEHADSKL